MLFELASYSPHINICSPTLGSFVTLGILKEAIVDILAVRGCIEAIEKPLLICDKGRMLMAAINVPDGQLFRININWRS
jgi:hypothetical protein